MMLWMLTRGTAAVLGLALGCWYKRHDNQWNIELKRLEREIKSDELAEAKELHRAEALRVIHTNERQAQKWAE